MIPWRLFCLGLLSLISVASAANVSHPDDARCLHTWNKKVARYREGLRIQRMRPCNAEDETTTYDKWIPNWVCEDTQRLPREVQGDGAKWMAGTEALQARRTPPLIYSFGCNGDIAWELEMRRRFPAAEVHIIDPTGNKRWKNLKLRFKLYKANLTLHEWWAGRSPPLDPANPESVFPTLTLSQMMAKLGHPGAVIDFLKMDIENAEWELFAVELKECRLRFHHLNIELHSLNCTEHEAFFGAIERCGYRVVWVEPNHWGCSGWSCVEFTIISSSLACAEFAHSHGCPPCSHWLHQPGY